MTDFDGTDLRGSRFVGVDLREAEFRRADLRGVTINGTLQDVRIRGDVIGVRIDGDIFDLVVNGVDLAPLLVAELDRRDPERVLMRPSDADGFRAAWELAERRWEETLERARRLSPDQLHESIEGEWSFIETLRHLPYATDVWLSRVVLGDPEPWDPMELPFDELEDGPGVPRDRSLRPDLDEVLRLRTDRQAKMRRYLADVTEADLDARTTPVEAPGFPPPDHYLVREVLSWVLNEEWQHRRYAERDLDALADVTWEAS